MWKCFNFNLCVEVAASEVLEVLQGMERGGCPGKGRQRRRNPSTSVGAGSQDDGKKEQGMF